MLRAIAMSIHLLKRPSIVHITCCLLVEFLSIHVQGASAQTVTNLKVDADQINSHRRRQSTRVARLSRLPVEPSASTVNIWCAMEIPGCQLWGSSNTPAIRRMNGRKRS